MSRTRSIHVIPSLALVAAAVAIAACGGTGQSFLTAPRNSRVDAVRPTVVGTLPGANQASVSRESLIQITFSEALDSSSVSSATVSFTGGVSGTLSVAGSAITFVPVPSLPPSTTITVTVAGVRDRAGNAMASPYVWSFTTAP